MIEAPENCPSCQSTLIWVKDTLYCQNITCPAKSAKQVEHFAKTLKIKGLGPAAIEKLMIEDISEIYSMDLAFVSALLNSAKLAMKLLEEIERSKQEPLNTVLPGFGIPLVGKSATEKLSQVCESIFDIDESTCKAAGIGPAATKNLMNWLENSFDLYCDLPFSFQFDHKPILTQEKGVVCISGKLKSYATKAEAHEALINLGYRVKDSLTKDVTILVNESGIESAKTIKAANSGVRVINNIKQLMENI